MSDVRIITNNVPRFTIDGFQLTAAERAQFDYHDWAAIDAGTDSATFFRYKGELYDMGNFMRLHDGGNRSDSDLAIWDGAESDSMFSATLVRYVNNDDYGYGEAIVVGRYLS